MYVALESSASPLCQSPFFAYELVVLIDSKYENMKTDRKGKQCLAGTNILKIGHFQRFRNFHYFLKIVTI